MRISLSPEGKRFYDYLVNECPLKKLREKDIFPTEQELYDLSIDMAEYIVIVKAVLTEKIDEAKKSAKETIEDGGLVPFIFKALDSVLSDEDE